MRVRRGGSASAPVMLPIVLLRPKDGGTVMITLDGQPVTDAAVPLVQLGEALAQIVDQLATAVRVELHEPDGTVHADILTPPAPSPPCRHQPRTIRMPRSRQPSPRPGSAAPNRTGTPTSGRPRPSLRTTPGADAALTTTGSRHTSVAAQT